MDATTAIHNALVAGRLSLLRYWLMDGRERFAIHDCESSPRQPSHWLRRAVRLTYVIAPAGLRHAQREEYGIRPATRYELLRLAKANGAELTPRQTAELL